MGSELSKGRRAASLSTPAVGTRMATLIVKAIQGKGQMVEEKFRLSR